MVEACELAGLKAKDEAEDALEDREPKMLPSPEDCEETDALREEKLELLGAEYWPIYCMDDELSELELKPKLDCLLLKDALEGT